MRRTLLVAAVLLAAALPALPTGAAGPDHVLITAVYYDTYVDNEFDEFVRLANPTGEDVDLSGWYLADGEGKVTFPQGAKLRAGASLVVAGKASDYRVYFLGPPDWEFAADTEPGVPQLAKSGTFALSNSGDEVRLNTSAHVVVDAVAYGNSRGTDGWQGAVLEDVSEGVVLERDAHELTGVWEDTDGAADWDDTRVWVAGQSRFGIATYDATGATMFSSPDASFAEVKAFLQGAGATLDIALYELTNAHIGDVLVDRAEDGVALRLLIEGGPVGFGEEERWQENSILERIVAAGGDVRFMVTNSSQDVHDRYAFQHGKFAVADGERVLAMSGNWKYSGLPVDDSTGNREWGVVVDSQPLASFVLEVFEHDWDDRNPDILAFGEGEDWRYLPPPAEHEENRTVPTGTYAPYFPAQRFEGPFGVTPVLSPDTSLRHHGSLLELIREATQEVLIEQMYAHKHWGPSATGTPATTPNLYLEAAIDAARNGAKVYVLLGDEFIEEEDTRNNYETVDYLRSVAQAENLSIFAKVVSSKIAELTKVHNKGVVVDKEVAVVSSINWGRNSAESNREVALMLRHADIAAFYREIFWYDWSPREFKPVTDLTVLDVRLAPQPLLGPVDVPAPLAPLPLLGSEVRVDHPCLADVVVTVANLGKHGAGDFNLTLDAAPTGRGDPEHLGKVEVNSLPAGATRLYRFPWNTLLHLGEFTLTAVVDSDGQVRETDEDNNVGVGRAVLGADVPGVRLAPPFAGLGLVAPPLPSAPSPVPGLGIPPEPLPATWACAAAGMGLA